MRPAVLQVRRFDDTSRGIWALTAGRHRRDLLTRSDKRRRVPTVAGGRPGAFSHDGDGSRDISDAIALLGYLFHGTPARLRCGSGLESDPGNRQIVDHTGNRQVDIADAVGLLRSLFSAGRPPAAGLECMPAGGCGGSTCTRS